MVKRVLVTGASGFVGRHFCEYLNTLNLQLDVTGIDIVEPGDNFLYNFITADMSCDEPVKNVIAQIRPDYIIHLAGTFGGGNSPQIYKVNVLSMAALLEAVVKEAPDSVVVATGSAAEYGRVGQEQLPIREECPCEPVTPYGLSKMLATQIAIYYHRVHNVNVTILRPFQLIGRGITSRLVPGAFAEQLKLAVDKSLKIIKTGNLEESRDFIDVNDFSKAIWKLCEKPSPGQIFNVCSGRAIKIADLLKAMIDSCGVDVKVEMDTERSSKSANVPIIYGSFEKLKNHCGWEPRISLYDSILSMFR